MITRTMPHIRRRQYPSQCGKGTFVMTTSSVHTHTSRPRSWTTPSAFRFLLISLVLTTCHWSPTSAAADTATAAEADHLDEKSLAMAHRIIQKVKDNENPPPSWNELLQVMESSFLGRYKYSNFYHKPLEEKGRQRALKWLAHEDDSSSNLSDDEYDRGLLQRYALATVYFVTGGDDWNRCSSSSPSQKIMPNTNNNAHDHQPTTNNSICESDEERYLSPYSHFKWNGIKGKDGQVTWLDLSGQGLTSPIFLPFEMTLLSPSLELLWVSENEELGGVLPNWLGEFQSLVSLSVYKTSVSGIIPESIYGNLPKLNSIRLYKSKFEGTISTQIEKLVELKWLWIHENEFTGTLPEEIGKLAKLEAVTLHGNKFAPIEENDDVEETSGNKVAPIKENEAGEASGNEVDSIKEDDASGLKPNVINVVDLFAPIKENDDVKTSGLESNIIPKSLCRLKKISLKYLWTDCEEGALSTSTLTDNEKEEFVVKEGVMACSCCTRCFPQNTENVAAAVN
ncbi:hypothetical protein ACHAXR_004531 [Thalassiosira sp. AJA248-18]